MIRGVGASRMGMLAEQNRTEVISNNLANLNTNGFKRSVAVGSEFEQLLLFRMGDALSAGDGAAPPVGRLGQGATISMVAPDESQGTLVETGNPLDVALQGPGAFLFQGPGGPGATRNGAFHRDSLGRLVTAEGDPLLVGGVPVGQGAAALSIQEDGTVVADGAPVGQLDITGSTGPVRLVLRSVEQANVDMAQEMTDLIVAMRSFQANQRAMQAQDETLERAVSEIGRV
jgi:flagellar basal-body rod protein FlgF